MKTLLLSAILALNTLACSTLTKPPVEPAIKALQPPSIKALDAVAVALVKWDDEEQRFDISCSGTWVGRRLVLTAAHCIDNEDQVYVRSNPGEQPLLAFARRYDKEHDLGLLAVAVGADSVHGVAAIGQLPEAGTDIQALNNTFGFENSYMRGYVSGYQRKDDTKPGPMFMMVMIPGSFGASGSGVFNAEGQIVGVGSWKVRGWDGSLFYVNAEDIARFLKSGGEGPG